MGKKIVVLTGSPRKGGNSFAMTDAFIQAAEEKGHEVVRFDAAMMKVGGCHDCRTCYSTGKACTYDDDFNRIAPELETADAVVFTMPLYWYTMPAQIKAVIDKFLVFFSGKVEVKVKEAGLICCCEEKDAVVLEGIRQPYLRTVQLLGWESVGEVLVPNVYRIGDIKKTDGEARAAALAEKF